MVLSRSMRERKILRCGDDDVPRTSVTDEVICLPVLGQGQPQVWAHSVRQVDVIAQNTLCDLLASGRFGMPCRHDAFGVPAEHQLSKHFNHGWGIHPKRRAHHCTQFAHQALGRYREADPESRHQAFGDACQIDCYVGREDGEAWRRVGKMKAVEIVLDDRHLVTARDIRDLPAAFLGQDRGGRILQGGDGVQDTNRCGTARRLERLRYNSPLKKALLTGFHSTAKHNATKAVSPSSETMRTI